MYKKGFNRYTFINSVKKLVFNIFTPDAIFEEQPTKFCERILYYQENHKLDKRRHKLYIQASKEFSACLKKQYGQKDVETSAIQPDHWPRFEQWLLKSGKRKQTTANNLLKILDTVMNDAVRNRVVERNPFALYQIKPVEVHRKALVNDEIQRIWRIPASQLTERENVSRWVALWQCFIGLSYSDLAKLRVSDLVKRNDVWLIRVPRNKTNVESIIPLCAEAVRILKMFNTEQDLCQPGRKLMPVPSYNRYNGEDLKVIQKKADIHHTLTTHILRHTFACEFLDKGGQAEVLQKMMGHKKLSTTMYYGKVSERRIINEAMKVFGNTTTDFSVAPHKVVLSEAYELKTQITHRKVHGHPEKVDKIKSDGKMKNNGRINSKIVAKSRATK